MTAALANQTKKYWGLYALIMLSLALFSYFHVKLDLHNNQIQADREIQQELQLLNKMTSRLLQTGEYDSVQTFFDQWGENYNNTLAISLTTKNSFEIAKYVRTETSEHQLTHQQPIKYGYRGLATLTITKDISWVYDQLQKVILLIIYAWLLLAAFGAFIVRNLLVSQRENLRLQTLSEKLSRAKASANKKEHLLKSLIDSIPDLIFIKDSESVYMGCNKAFEKYANCTEAELYGKTDFDFFSRDTAVLFRSNDQLMMQSKAARRNEEWVTYPDGHKVLLDTLKTPYYDTDGRVLGLIGISRDITELKHFQNQLEDLAYHDPLTRLPNRRFLIERMNMAIAHADRNACKFAVCAFDLDGFKAINDRLGHEAGDKVLIEFANRLKNELRNEDTIARWGGDEFTILFSELKSNDESIELIERLQKLISVPVEVDELSFVLSASIGMTVYPDDKSDTDTLLRHADQAMYDAKLAGKNRYHFFDTEQNKKLHDHHEYRSRISQAIDNNEMVLYYQPQIHLPQGAPYGAEVLIRWKHPQRGILSPADFMPYINEHAINIKLDWWVLENAIAQLDKWLKEGKFFHLSINLSAQTFHQSDFVKRLFDLFSHYSNVSPSMFSLELLETAALGNLDEVSEKMKSCQQRGIQFSLDDFGTGYSSLSYLSRLPADVLKIDRTFIRDLLVDENDASIVEAIIRLAAAFNRMVIAEGVEEIMQGIRLIEMGCHYAQGYAIAKPMPADKLHEWLTHFKAPQEWLSYNAHSVAGSKPGSNIYQLPGKPDNNK